MTASISDWSEWSRSRGSSFRYFSAALAGAALLLLGQGTPAADKTAKEPSYYTDSQKDGWWWYKYKPPEEEAPEDTAEKPPERHFPSLSDYTKEDLWNMHPEDLKALLDDFRNKAVMNPTHENVTEYYRVQDVVRRKALAFAAVSAEVMEKYPDLDVGGAYSNAIPGNLAMVRTQNREIEDTIRSARDDFALLYFYQPNCEFCVAQDKILKFFMEKYGWQVRKINRYENGALAGTLDVDLVPTLLMIERDEPRHVAVARGVVALNELEANLYRGIRFLRGNVGPEEYPMFDYQKGGPFDVHAAPDWNTKK